MDTGFIKIAALSPVVEVANPNKNMQSALDEIFKAAEEKAQVIVLPELFLSGYTCADLFFQKTLIDECKKSLLEILEKIKNIDALIVMGMPLCVDSRLYNVAVVMQKGKVLGFVPKTYIENGSGFYEKRWFTSGKNAKVDSVCFNGTSVPFGRTLFKMGDSAIVGVEICEDLWAPIAPSSIMALEGANIILNLSATQEIATKYKHIKEVVRQQSAKGYCAYAFASGSTGESTTDFVLSNACIVAENGKILAQGQRFKDGANRAVACVDIQNINAERISNSSFADNADDCVGFFGKSQIVDCNILQLVENEIDRKVDSHPFIPSDINERDERCKEILSIQVAGLLKRMKYTGMKKAIIGVSGGLDSTLALLVTAKAMERLSFPMKNIICVTMPGFGTTDETYKNAIDLISAMGADFREIDICPACIQHMEDIGHDINIHDITYENTQARERTQILMDLANKEGALLIGTGDLSELALGWCTYNGDHMSMYGVNTGVPKTLIYYLVENIAKYSDEKTSKVLLKVLDTPVSPELLPPNEKGEIQQKTEEQIGPYELHDFFLYHFIRFGTTPAKLQFLAKLAFGEKYSKEEIENWSELFLKRFFTSQFKRSCLPDGIKIGTVSLSPRGDFKMPSDANPHIWQY